MHHFCNGLTGTTRTLIDALVGGALMRKSANEVYRLLEDMALNNCQWLNERAMPQKPSRVHGLDVFNNLVVQVSMLIKKLQFTQLQSAQAMENVIKGPTLSCYFCNGPHSTIECKMGNMCGISLIFEQIFSTTIQSIFKQLQS